MHREQLSGGTMAASYAPRLRLALTNMVLHLAHTHTHTHTHTKMIKSLPTSYGCHFQDDSIQLQMVVLFDHAVNMHIH